MTKFLTNVGLFLFFTFSTLLIIIYFGLLYEKITRPTFKNMDTEGFLWFGLLMGLFITADIFILRRFIRSLRRKNSG
jgi:hypothetical protein